MKPTGPIFDKAWRARCTVSPLSRIDADRMIKQHYLGRWPGVCVCILGLFEGMRAVGVIVFALPPRETAKRYGGWTWELARLWIENSVPTNAETYFMAAAIRHVRKCHPDVEVLVSYADPSVGHDGTIYRAANWVADGRTDQERKTPRFDYVDALTGKHYSRRSHVPEGRQIRRIARVSKHRFVYRLRP